MNNKRLSAKVNFITTLLSFWVALNVSTAYATFDIDKGIKAATEPLVNFASTGWGKFILIAAIAPVAFKSGTKTANDVIEEIKPKGVLDATNNLTKKE
jgi:hypothetical protein